MTKKKESRKKNYEYIFCKSCLLIKVYSHFFLFHEISINYQLDAKILLRRCVPKRNF